ncbi:MAG: hypothetical protein KatS3mg087_1207 [Patescibacteria group bacterium]|nr:MAG: hypothetical protein KatS3mg087_1207 [Patescibacteria group bacterium]
MLRLNYKETENQLWLLHGGNPVVVENINGKRYLLFPDGCLRDIWLGSFVYPKSKKEAVELAKQYWRIRGVIYKEQVDALRQHLINMARFKDEHGICPRVKYTNIEGQQIEADDISVLLEEYSTLLLAYVECLSNEQKPPNVYRPSSERLEARVLAELEQMESSIYGKVC